MTSFGKGFTIIEKEIEKDLTGEERVRSCVIIINTCLFSLHSMFLQKGHC